MKRFNNFRRLLRAAAVMTAVAAMTFAGCTKVDDTLGSNLVPDNQQMKAGYETFGALTLKGDLNPRRYVETRLYQTDSLITSNLTYGYMGSMLSDTFVLPTAPVVTIYYASENVSDDLWTSPTQGRTPETRCAAAVEARKRRGRYPVATW